MFALRAGDGRVGHRLQPTTPHAPVYNASSADRRARDLLLAVVNGLQSNFGLVTGDGQRPMYSFGFNRRRLTRSNNI